MAAAGALESGDLELEPRLQLLRAHLLRQNQVNLLGTAYLSSLTKNLCI